MHIFTYPHSSEKNILALGAESAGNFSFFKNGQLFFSPDFGDLLEENNFKTFQKAVLAFLRKEALTPDMILTDLHPNMHTTLWGQELCKKYGAQYVPVQHHLAHIFSAIGEKLISDPCYMLHDTCYGIAMDGTGLGLDEKIWGGECFAISNLQFPISNEFSNHNDKISKQKAKISNERVGHLENQIMIGGELAIQEPARILISILSKFLPEKKIYDSVKKYYAKNEFEVLYSQLQQNFNCVETSSTGRVLDAVSILLGFCTNERKYKHEAIFELEANSTEPYLDIKPKIDIIDSNLIYNLQFPIYNEFSMIEFSKKHYILNTTYLFEYLIKNLHKDKKRLAATAQLYLAQGLYEIISKSQISNLKSQIFLSGGIANNKIISEYLVSKGAYVNQKIPRGDAGLSFGQIMFFLNQ